MSVWPATSQNLVYADVTGSIGWQLFGEAQSAATAGERCRFLAGSTAPAGRKSA